MKRQSWMVALALIIFGASLPLGARSVGAPQGHSGAPGDNVCTACHTTNAANSGPGNVRVTFASGTIYNPGQTQKVTVTISDPNGRRWGFQASPRVTSSASTGAGQVAPSDDNTQIIGTSGSLQWITHTSAGTRNGTAGPQTFEFNWTPPATNVGDVDFYVAANAANGGATNQGDFIYTTKVTLAASTGPAQRPTISETNGAVSSADSRAGVVAGSWLTIYGQNLSTTTRSWRADEFVNNRLPTSLDGVSLTVNGRPAAISYVSGTQINAIAPDDTSTGNVNVIVTNAAGESTPRSVPLRQFSPALFRFTPQDNRYVAAVALNAAYLAPAGLFGTTLTTRPARPGETILLFGTGFGPTNPSVPSGQVFSGAARLTNDVRITIGGVAADVSFAGLSSPGLYQFNIVVPATVSDGDREVVVTVGGVQSPSGAFLAVAR